jgi:hypothetical protein
VILRRLLLLSLVLICAINLGCSIAEPYGWQVYPRWLSLPPVWKQVDQLPKGCVYRDLVTYARFKRDWIAGVCWIYSLESEGEAREDTRVHERKHCKGFDHLAPTVTPVITYYTR